MADDALTDAVTEVLAACDDPPGWTNPSDSEHALVYECNCGDQSPVLAHEWILEEDVAKAAAWHLRHRAEQVARVLREHTAADTDDGMANDCTHQSASGVDTTPLSDPAKVWRCDHCGLRWREDGEPLREHTAAKQAEAWAACVAEAEGLGWMHDLAADDVASRNPYRAERLHPEPSPDGGQR